jgi:small subunit ribosomal protein S16
MLKMRLQRIGRKNSPAYRVVVVDSRESVASRVLIDTLGSYEPKSGKIEIDGERAKHWLSKGVQPSPTVHNMLVGKKVINAEKITVIAPKKEEPKAEAAPENAPANEGEVAAESTPAPEEAPKEEVAS